MAEEKDYKPDRTRIEVPEVSLDSTNLEAVRSGNNFLEVYREKDDGGDLEAREKLMEDLMLEQTTKNKEAPTTLKVKVKVCKEFCRLSGASYPTAVRYWKKISKSINKVMDMGLIGNYAMTVKTNLIEKMYRDLAKMEQDNASARSKLGLYKLLLETADSITSVAVKQEGNEIKRDQNEILAKKVGDDAKLGAAQIAMNFESLSREDRENLAISALMSTKTVLNPIMDSIEND